MTYYRYKAPNDGLTRSSIKGLAKIDKLGELISIEAYSCLSPKGSSINRIMVRGTIGTATYGGFCWGYFGEGPRGLVELFVKCGMDRETAKNIALGHGSTLPTFDFHKYANHVNRKTVVWKFIKHGSNLDNLPWVCMDRAVL